MFFTLWCLEGAHFAHKHSQPAHTMKLELLELV